MGKAPVAVVDLSWVMHTFRHAYRNVVRVDDKGVMLPAGHVFGTIRVVQELAGYYKAVLLAVDSRADWRYELLPEYKSGRHTVTGSAFEDYKIFSDLVNITKLLHNIITPVHLRLVKRTEPVIITPRLKVVNVIKIKR